MVLKGSVLPKHIPVNNYELLVEGLPPLLFTEVSGADRETEKVDMPDRTVASGGNEKASEVTCMMFEHHAVELQALQAWRQEGQDPVTTTYKKTCTLIKRNISGEVATTQTWIGAWPTNRKDPDLEMANEGDPAMVEWTLSVDKIEDVV